MATILVDYENVANTRGLRGVEYLNSGDKLYIFFSDNCCKLRAEELNYIKDSNCKFKVVKLVKKGKNGLDFYIATTVGIEYEKGERQMVIVSNDKGFMAVTDYMNTLPDASDIRIVRSSSIENGLSMLSDENNEYRRRRIIENNQMKDLVEAQAYIEAKANLQETIDNILMGTKFEKDSVKISRIINMDTKPSKKTIYCNYLHEYGLKEGLELYRMLKEVV